MRGGGFFGSSNRGGLMNGRLATDSTDRASKPFPKKTFNTEDSGWSNSNHLKLNEPKKSQDRDNQDMDSWEPITEDFNNNNFRNKGSNNVQNTHSSGFKGGNRAPENQDPAIYIRYIPSEVDEEGLRNIFRENVPRHEPTRVSVMPNKNGPTDIKFGFVHYRTLNACEDAIRQMNGFKIGTRSLLVALGKNSVRNGTGGGHNSHNPRPFSSNHDRGTGGAFQVDRKYFDSSKGVFVNNPSSKVDQNNIPSGRASPCDARITSSGWAATSKGTSNTNTNRSCGNDTLNKADSWDTASTHSSKSGGSKPASTHSSKSAGSKPAAGLGKPIGSLVAEIPQPKITMDTLPKIKLPERARSMYVSGDSPLGFYVQLVNNQTVISGITDKLAEVYHDSEPDFSFTPKEGEVIVADFHGDWYRALVLQEGMNKLKVLYIDYGNMNEVGLGDVRRLTCLTHVEPQAVLCRLTGVVVPNEHYEETIQFFRNLVIKSEDSLIISCVKEQEQEFNVNVTLKSGEDLADILSTAGHAQKLTSENKVYKELEVKLNEKYVVNAAYIISAKELYVSMISECTKLYEMMGELTTYIHNTTPGGDISVGDAVAANYMNVSYRTVVLDKLPGNKLKVKFVDFGNIEVVDMMEVYRLPAELLVLPQQSVKCTLDVDVSEGHMDTVTKFLKTELPDDQSVDAKFVGKEGDKYIIKIKKEGGTEITKQLIESGKCTAPLKNGVVTSTPVSRNGPTKPAAQNTSPFPNPTKPAAQNTSPFPNPTKPAAQNTSPFSNPTKPTVQNTSPFSNPTKPTVQLSSANSQSSLKPVYYSPKITQLPISEAMLMAVCEISTPTTIYANFSTPAQEAAEDFLSEVRGGGDGSVNFETMGIKPEIDQLVLCYSDEFNEWYRGVVKAVTSDSCMVYSLDYGNTNSFSLNDLVPGEEKHNAVAPLAFAITFQGSEQILAKMRNSVPKSDWTTILNGIFKQPFEAEIVAQDGLDVTVKPKFDLKSQLKEKIKPLVRPNTTKEDRESPAPSSASSPALNTASHPPGYSIVPSREWEQILLDNDRLKRTQATFETRMNSMQDNLEQLRLENDRLKRALRLLQPNIDI